MNRVREASNEVYVYDWSTAARQSSSSLLQHAGAGQKDHGHASCVRSTAL